MPNSIYFTVKLVLFFSVINIDSYSFDILNSASPHQKSSKLVDSNFCQFLPNAAFVFVFILILCLGDFTVGILEIDSHLFNIDISNEV